MDDKDSGSVYVVDVTGKERDDWLSQGTTADLEVRAVGRPHCDFNFDCLDAASYLLSTLSPVLAPFEALDLVPLEPLSSCPIEVIQLCHSKQNRLQRSSRSQSIYRQR